VTIIPIKPKLKVFTLTVFRALLFLIVAFSIGLVDIFLFDKKIVSFGMVISFISPYYALWLVLIILSISRRGRSFQIIRMGSLRDEVVFSLSNAPYAFSFLIGSVLILVVQVCCFY